MVLCSACFRLLCFNITLSETELSSKVHFDLNSCLEVLFWECSAPTQRQQQSSKAQSLNTKILGRFPHVVIVFNRSSYLSILSKMFHLPATSNL